MNELQIFNNKEFGQIRTVMINNEPWFIVSDICKCLNLTNPTISMQQLDNDEKAKLNLGLSGGATNCVNEYGLYSLVMSSRKKEAKDFKRWVTHEVLPSIRKTGSYSAHKPMTQIEILQGAINLLAEQGAEIKAIKNISQAQNSRIGDIEKEIQSLKEMNVLDMDNWRLNQRLLINKLAKVYPVLAGFTPFEAIRNELYDDLETLCNCNLTIRLRNKKERALKAGTPPYIVKRLNYLDVIEEDKKLIANYMMLLKNKMIKYGALN